MAPPRSLALAAPLTAQAEDEGALVSLASGGGLESAEEEGGRVQSLCRVLVPVRHLTGAIGDRRSPQVTFKSEPLSRLEPDHCGTRRMAVPLRPHSRQILRAPARTLVVRS